MSPRIKYIFVYRTIETWFYNADHLLYYPQMTVFSFHIFFCSLVSVSKKLNIETMLSLPSLFIQLAKFQQNEWKRSQEYQSMDPEYVTGQINSCILEFLLRRFCSLILAPSQKFWYALVWWSSFLRTTKDILAIYKCRYCIEWFL